jgi:pimeloyl-ACP methyl ester carboxylesterase
MFNINHYSKRIKLAVIAMLVMLTLTIASSGTTALPAWAKEKVVGDDGLSGLNGPSQQDEGIMVQRVDFPVILSDGNTYSVAGYLYYRSSFHNRTLQVVMHGGTYNHKYWDAPSINGHPYSYARFMAEQQYAVLALDQLGAGDSSKPDGDFVTLAETTSALHQVLVQLRSNSNPLGYAFAKIILVGHSFGSINAIYVQTNHHDADALVVTGYGHVPHKLPFEEALIAELVQDPYFTLPPEVREAAFYYKPVDGTAAADQAVIDYDNSNLTDLVTRGQIFTTFASVFQDPVGAVSGPVLVQLGEHDALWPALYAPDEAAYWTSAASITVQSLPNVGHSFNLHLDNRDGWRQIDQWVAATVGRN